MDATQPTNGVVIESVTKRFDDVAAVNGVSIEIRKGEFFSLLGPSGCGKTTLLRIVAGFETPDEGRIRISGKDVTGVAPQKRPTAMVFQNYALFPNMSVRENVAYGLRVRKTAPEERSRRVMEALRRVHMDALADRRVDQLSGGQQQRVAVARAIAVEPDVLLFDEPLSNLDVALRENTRNELRSIQRELGRTSIYVTHDQQEALVLSDRIGVMRDGALVEVGSPTELFNNPKTSFVASFLSGCNIVDDPTLAQKLSGLELPDGHSLAVRPDELEILADASSGVEAAVTSRSFLGLHTELHVDVGGTSLRVAAPPDFPSHDRVFLSARHHRVVSQ